MLLALYILLLLLNAIVSLLLGILTGLETYVEIFFFGLWCQVLQPRAISWFLFPVLVALTLITLAVVIITVNAVIWVGLMLGLMWWVWVVGMLLLPESGRLVECLNED
jgi:hypothetical protein